MQLTNCVECHGKVKYSGLDTGNVPWKNGKLVVQLVNGTWRMNLEYDVSKGAPQKSYVLSPGVIKKLICKAQLVIELQPDGRNHSQLNLHIKPEFPHQNSEMNKVHEKLKEIQKLNEEPVKARAEVKMSPTSLNFNRSHQLQSNQSSPETFTRYSVKTKENRKRTFEDSSDEEEGKENFRSKTASEMFLERGCEKSKSWLSSESTPKKFYGNKSPDSSFQASYSTYSSAKKTPGLMPDPEKKRLGSISYSWAKPKLTSPTGSQQQQNLHGFSNLGNTCYMNAILQSLVHLDTFTTDLLYGNKRMLRTLPPTSLYKCMELVFNSRLKNVPDFSKREYLKNLKQAISSSAKRFSGYQQHDAHEFLGQLLDQLKEEVTKMCKSTPSPHRDDQDADNKSQECVNPTVQNFEFEVLHQIRCEDCGEEVTKEEQFIDLSIDMPRSRDPTNPRSLQDALEMSLRKEHIEYTCEKCRSNKAIVTHKFTKLPRVLILHLKRYSYNMAMSRQAKAGQNIAIPRYLTLQSHSEEQTRPPFPTIPPQEPSSLSVPDSPLREKNENTPRRRLDTNYRFKKIRALPDFDLDGDSRKTETQQTSTPSKRLSDPGDVITDRKLTLDDDYDDPELAKALELSLKEASDRAQGYYDEVDGMVEDGDLKKVLEMSRNENESRSNDHDYDSTLRIMTEEEQIELAMKRSMMEFEMSHNSYMSEDIRRECSSAYADELFMGQELKPCDKKIDNIVTSKYFKSERGNNLDKNSTSESVSMEKEEGMCSFNNNCDKKSTYELTENSYFHSHVPLSRDITQNSKNCDIANNETTTVKRECNVFNVGKKNEVMVISDTNIDSESEVKAAELKSFDLSMEVSDSDTCELNNDGTLCNLKAKPESDEKAMNKNLLYKSKDLDSILLVDEMTSSDIKNIRTVDLTAKSHDSEKQEDKSTDIVDLFCNEDDDMLIEQWDKENFNPGNNKEEESLPRIDNEKGDLPYSYRLVSIVNHIGSSSVVGHYVSDVYDIKKSSWFSCDDSHVSRTTETEVRSKRERTGYIFFYLSKDIFDDLKDHYAIQGSKKEAIKK